MEESTIAGGADVAAAPVSAAHHEIVDLLFRAILRRPPDKSGFDTYTRLLSEGRHELDLVKILCASDEFDAKDLIPIAYAPAAAFDDYDYHTDPEIARLLTPGIRTYNMKLRRASLDRSAFEAAASAALTPFPQPEYLNYHRERFYEIDCIVNNLALNGGSILDVGLSVNSFILAKLFPGALVSVVDRPEIGIHEQPFVSRYSVDLTEDGLDGMDLGSRFDLIVFSEVIEHLLVHPVKVIRFLIRHLTQQGKMILTTPNLFSHGKLQLIRRRVSPMTLYPLHYTRADAAHFHIREYSMSEMLSMIGIAGARHIAFYFSGCWDDPAMSRRIPEHELGNMVFVFEASGA